MELFFAELEIVKGRENVKKLALLQETDTDPDRLC